MDLISNNPTMYLPVLLSLQPVIQYLDGEWQHLGLSYDLILTELLKEILSSELGTFGRNGEGPYGAFKCQAPENRVVDEFNETRILQEAHMLLVDVISDVVPRDIHRDTYPHYYANGDTFILYIPIDPTAAPDHIRTKLVPYPAVRHLDR